MKTTRINGRVEYRLNGTLHNIIEPAVIEPNGTKKWFWFGKKNRPNGPAVIVPNGPKYWFQNGTLHRTDGPAVVLPNKSHFWWINGRQFTFESWLDEIEKICGSSHFFCMKMKWM